MEASESSNESEMGKKKGKASSSGDQSARVGGNEQGLIVVRDWMREGYISPPPDHESYFDNLLWVVKQVFTAYYRITTANKEPNFCSDWLVTLSEGDPEKGRFLVDRLFSHSISRGLKLEDGSLYYPCGFSAITGDHESHIMDILDHHPVVALLQTGYREYLELGKGQIYGDPYPSRKMSTKELEDRMLAPPLEGYTYSPVVLLGYGKFEGRNVWFALSSLGVNHADNGRLTILRKSSMQRDQENLLYEVYFPDGN